MTSPHVTVESLRFGEDCELHVTVESLRFGEDCELHVFSKESGQIWYHIRDADREGIVLNGSEMDTLVQIYLRRKEGRK